MTKDSKYKVVLKSANGVEIDSSTDDIENSLLSFKPLSITNKILLTVSTPKKTIEKIIFAPYARKLFFNSLYLKLFVRNIERSLQ